MRCIVCDNDVRIETLKQLFSLQPLLLCHECSKHLIPNSIDVLYRDNDWVRSIIERLNRGDLALIAIFKPLLQKVLSKKGAHNFNIRVIETSKNIPYPWLEILVNDSVSKAPKKNLVSSAEALIITVEKEKNNSCGISIVG